MPSRPAALAISPVEARPVFRGVFERETHRLEDFPLDLHGLLAPATEPPGQPLGENTVHPQAHAETLRVRLDVHIGGPCPTALCKTESTSRTTGAPSGPDPQFDLVPFSVAIFCCLAQYLGDPLSAGEHPVLHPPEILLRHHDENDPAAGGKLEVFDGIESVGSLIATVIEPFLTPSGSAACLRNKPLRLGAREGFCLRWCGIPNRLRR